MLRISRDENRTGARAARASIDLIEGALLRSGPSPRR
jgi:hypothetical protein